MNDYHLYLRKLAQLIILLSLLCVEMHHGVHLPDICMAR